MLFLYTGRLARAGIDLRWGFWEFWQNNRFYSDVDNALHHGHFVLRLASALEHKDQLNHFDSSGDGSVTISSPGPGLLDAPLSFANLRNRWRRLQPVYAHIYRGWTTTYNQLVDETPDGDYQMDYPPLRSLVMTLWAWKVDSQYPAIVEVPRQPMRRVNRETKKPGMVSADIIRPLLICNMTFEAISAVAIFFLVWLWVHRDFPTIEPRHWRQRWGDPLLLTPIILFGIFTLAGPFIRFESAGFSPGANVLDMRIASPGWCIHLLLKFTAAVALARFLPRPFRGIACGMVAMTVAWMNPATVLESFGWPQWEAWLIPFFLIPALLISLNWWLAAGFILSIGCMFKGQLMFVAPMLILCPLFVGWFGRFMRIVAGFGAGSGLIVWPWLINSSRAGIYVLAALFAAAMICVVSSLRRQVWRDLKALCATLSNRPPSRGSAAGVSTAPAPVVIRWPIWIAITMAVLTAIYLSLLCYRDQDPHWHHWTVSLMLGIVFLPWFLPRRHIAGWIVFVFAAAVWLAGTSLGGSFSWWQVGFVYGTQKHQSMQLGAESLSNLSSLLATRYGWDLHDAVGTLHLPMISDPVELDVQSALAALFGIALLLCTIAAAVHLRRRDKQFLVALVAPWILFVTLLTQMAARYTVFPAVIAAVLIGVSTGMSLLQVLLITLSCAMLGNQLLSTYDSTAPLTYSITKHFYPDMGWLMLLLAAGVLVSTMMPSRTPRHTTTVKS